MCKNRLSNGSSEHLCFLIINNTFATLTSSTSDEFLKKNAKQQMDRNWIQVYAIEKQFTNENKTWFRFKNLSKMLLYDPQK